MTEVEKLAAFVAGASWDDLFEPVREALKIRVLDAVGCALGALEGEPILILRGQVEEFGGAPLCTTIGGGKTAPDRAAFVNGALVRYLDFNDSFLAKGETCHPSDNLGAALAAAEYAKAGGKELLTALAVAYQVQCRLSEVAPVRHRGFDHVTQGVLGAAAGAGKALGLEPARLANALAIAGTAYNPLRVTRTGRLSHWKGLAFPDAGRNAVHAAFLAAGGITGPLELFEGNKGWLETISGPWELDWSREGLDAVTRTILKKFNAEIHSQSTLEAVLELRSENGFRGEEIDRVDLEIFDVAYHIIGGGEEGNKYEVRIKEQADHSLPYLVATALLDGRVGPDQFRPERIEAADVQALLRRVFVRPDAERSRRFPQEVPVKVTLLLRDGRVLEREKRDYEGSFTRPMSWERAREKFEALASPYAGAELCRRLSDAVRHLEDVPVAELTALLAEVGKERR